MYKEILRSIGGIDVFPVFSLVIFLAVFTAVLVRTFRLDRRRVIHLASLPLDPPAGPCDGDETPGSCRSEAAR